ncbi:MAG: DUF2846 domain-containing protein [Bacteroidales bacterium]|nr:DUF2846 domain-containing protein [Bacteroidales bacterium]
MKPTKVFFLFSFVFFQLYPAGLSASVSQTEPGNVYFFRLPNYMGSAAKMTILSNNQPITRLRNAAFFRYEAEPGDYEFSISFGSSSKVNLTVESGKDYYIKCYYNTGLWGSIPILELIDPVSGKSSIEGNNLAEQAVEQILLKERKSRVGLLLSGGIGFESYPWFVDENINDVNLSTGGGFGIGAEYGHQFGKNFDLSFTCTFQSSSLSENLKNASASYNRLVLSLTPALVIPVKGGELLRFRLGAGPGLYALGTMKIDASEAGGDKYTFKYDPALGIHALFLFEFNFMERGSMNLGVRYSNVTYNFNPSGSSDILTDPELVKSNGSGVDFILGYNFLF